MKSEVRRDALKCQLELCGQPEQVGQWCSGARLQDLSAASPEPRMEQVVEAESFCEETVRPGN